MNKSTLSCLLGISLSAIAQTSNAIGVPWMEVGDAGNDVNSPQLITGSNIGSIQGTLTPETTETIDFYAFTVRAGQALTVSVEFINIQPGTSVYATTTKATYNTQLFLFNTSTSSNTLKGNFSATATTSTIFARSGRTVNCTPPSGSDTCPVGTPEYNAIVGGSNNFFFLPTTQPTFSIAAPLVDSLYKLGLTNGQGGMSSYLVTFNNVLNPAAIPEPGSLGLMGVGLAAAYANRRRRLLPG